MSDSSRRGFLKVAGVGIAAAGSAAVLPAAAADAATPTAAKATALPHGATGSFVAHVEDVHSGTVTLMIEGESYTVRDPELVARLSHAVHAAKSA